MVSLLEATAHIPLLLKTDGGWVRNEVDIGRMHITQWDIDDLTDPNLDSRPWIPVLSRARAIVWVVNAAKPDLLWCATEGCHSCSRCNLRTIARMPACRTTPVFVLVNQPHTGHGGLSLSDIAEGLRLSSLGPPGRKCEVHGCGHGASAGTWLGRVEARSSPNPFGSPAATPPSRASPFPRPLSQLSPAANPVDPAVRSQDRGSHLS
ncbi:hypothetical protein PAPYR_6820 [Paratrimastix pyriformis]|uniref:Uncharacterized protein n=1 Tax=Paratrimastix pyriformis TaxID=342808 RepID=A0ABQ8UEK0_9EUKA|nr:hypothetical protein PAPYR_6820 [Paratrimastix pyriformis]